MCDEAYEAIRMILVDRGRAVPIRTVHQTSTDLISPESMWVQIVPGALVGALLGFLLRPSVPLVGQLPFELVISRGGNLSGLDAFIKGAAEQSFNYLLAGTILGAVAGVVLARLLKTRS